MKRLLLFSPTWPEQHRTAAGVRSFQFCRWLCEAGWSVAFASAAKRSEAASALDDLGVETWAIELNDLRLIERIQNWKPNVVIFERFLIEEAFSWMVREACPLALRVLDTVDLHSLRDARRVRAEAGDSLADILATRPGVESDVFLRELAAMHRSDLVWTVSPAEEEIAVQEWGVDPQKLQTLPLARDRLGTPPSFASRANVVTIGNFRHPPNLDAFRRLRDDLWPRIRAVLPGRECHVYGAYPPAEVMQELPEGLRSFGPAKDAVETLSRYRLSLAPLWFGAGQKGKILDSIAAGTLPVSTTIGAEGMGVPVECVAATAAAFVERVGQLYESESQWHSVLSACTVPAETEIRDAFLQALADGVERLERLRARNFSGAILLREKMRSTEFFSRWIAEKNKDHDSG